MTTLTAYKGETEDLGGECFNSLLQRTFMKHLLQAGSMLSHRDLTMCGGTDETRAITLSVASGRRSYDGLWEHKGGTPS